MIVLLTVGLPIPLKEVPRPDLLLAVGADKVLRVPGFPHGCNYLLGRQIMENNSISSSPRPHDKIPAGGQQE